MAGTYHIYRYKSGNKTVCFITHDEVSAEYQVHTYPVSARKERSYIILPRVEDAMTVAEAYCRSKGYSNFHVVDDGIYYADRNSVAFKKSKYKKMRYAVKSLREVNERFADNVKFHKDFNEKLISEGKDASRTWYSTWNLAQYEGKWSPDDDVMHPYRIDILNRSINSCNERFNLDLKPIPYDHQSWQDELYKINEHYKI